MQLQKTVFISYRRTDLPLALLVFRDLTQHGYDVFIDYDGIAAGDFEQNIVENIRSRAHFLVVLSPKALRRCAEPGDWLRREIEAAIASRRNIVPLMFDHFDFSATTVARSLTGELALLPKYNGLRVPLTYLEEAMRRLREAYLSKPLETVMHPASMVARQAATEQRAAAAAASGSAVSDRHRDDPAPRQSGTAEAKQATARAAEVVRPASAAGSDADPGRDRDGEEYPVRSVVSQSDKEAVARYRKAANQGDPHGQTWLAFMYANGTGGLSRNDEDAVFWYRKATDQRHAPAQAGLGFMYQNGRGGLRQSDEDAVVWYRKAAEQGCADGQVCLGFMYQNGRGGLPQSDVEAVAWYREAADQDNGDGQAYLAFMYETGRGGLPRSEGDAVVWYRKAAAKGHAHAQVCLGFMYQQGRGGLRQSDQDAVAWYRKAADQGKADGQALLAFMYETGRGGLARSTSDAIAWYRKAAAQGNDYAGTAIERLTGGK